MNRTLISSIIGTKGGWLSRQLLKFITIGSSSITAWLLAKDVPAETTTLIVAGIVAGVSWLAELGLSKLASKIAVPCLACCLMLSSCSTDLTGEKSFLGVTSKSFQAELKDIGMQLANATTQAAAKAVLDVAEVKLNEATAKLAANTDANPLVILALTKGVDQAQSLVMQARLKVAAFRFGGKEPVHVSP